MLETLTTLFQPWADFYSASAVLPTAIIALHLLALLAGGGVAIAADRQVLRTASDRRESVLAMAEELRHTHRVVIGALTVMILSGAALATADLGTYATSRVFWAKMAALTGLLVNGVLMRQSEARVLAMGAPVGDAPEPAAVGPSAPSPAWVALRRNARISLVGWFVVTFLGAVVANV